MTRSVYLITSSLLSLAAVASTASAAFINVDSVYQIAESKYGNYNTANATVAGNYPTNSTGTSWTKGSSSDWRAGFTPGVYWKIFGHTGASSWSNIAQKWTAGMSSVTTDNSTHDVGFRSLTSYGEGYKLLPDGATKTAYKNALLQTAYTLSTRYNDKVKSIRSWDSINDTTQFRVIIDNMMNLELEEFGAVNGGTSSFANISLDQIARNHANTAMSNHVRANGSTYHVLNYNQTTGALIGPVSGQGNNSDLTNATWSRGQSWAMNGFTMMYRYTHDAAYLATAQKTADYWISQLPVTLNTGLKDYVPPADFTSTYTDIAHKDSSAAAIAADALLELATDVSDPALKQKYTDIAVATLQELTTSTYLSSDSQHPGLLFHSAQDYTSNVSGENYDFPYGDYYLLDALDRYDAQALPEPAALSTICIAAIVTLRRRGCRMRAT